MTQSIPTALVLEAGAIIEERLGIALIAQMRAMIHELLATLGGEDVPAYLDALRHNPTTSEVWQRLIDELTVGETYFLRDRSHFHLLRHHILPELIQHKRETGRHTLGVWSAGCATGEEPYSVAVTLYEMLRDLDDWQITIVGTDVSAASLAVARRGVYRRWAFRHTSPDFKQTYFSPNGEGLEIKPVIRRMVSFRQSNLLEDIPLPTPDLILCRNVLLYFSASQTRRAEDRFYSILAPGGWLLLGHAEAISHQRGRWMTHLFPETPPAYQKPFQPVAARAPAFPVTQHAAVTTQETPQPPDDTDALARYQAAVQALHDDDIGQAETLALALIREAPRHSAAYVLAASIAANRQQIETAQRYVDMALEISPLFADAHYLRSVLFIELGEMEKARRSLRAAIYSQQGHALASYLLANLHAQAGEINHATRHWRNTHNAIADLPPDAYLSDFSDVTAAQMHALVREQLAGWKD